MTIFVFRGDDIALVSNTRDALQDITTGRQNNGMKVGLWISSEKTKAVIVGEHQAIPLTVEQKGQVSCW